MSLHPMWVSVVGTVGGIWMVAWGAVKTECKKWAETWLGLIPRLCPLGKALQWCASIFPDLANGKLGKVISSYSYSRH